MLGAYRFLRTPEGAGVRVYRVVPEIFCLDAWRRCRDRKEMILQLVESRNEERGEAAEVRKNDFDVRETAGNVCLHELQHAEGVFQGSADGPGQFCGLDHRRTGVAANRMNEENGFAAIELGKKSVKGRIGDAFSEDGGARRYSDHAQFVERAFHLVNRSLNVRKRSASKGRKAFRVFMNDAHIKIVGTFC